MPIILDQPEPPPAVERVTEAQVDAVPYKAWLQLSELYPAQALQQGIEGRAAVQCDVAGRAFSNCKPIDESPTGQGFGRAAAEIAQSLHPNERFSADQRRAGHARLEIRFRVPWSADDPPGGAPTFALRGPFAYLQKPGPNDMAYGYPAAAAHRSMQGEAVISCHIQADGRMRDCAVTREAPLGVGFGEASLRLMPLFRVDMSKGPGLVAAGKMISIPIRWLLPH
jgi:TonB family protein